MENNLWKQLCERLSIDRIGHQTGLTDAADGLHIDVGRWLKNSKGISAANSAFLIDVLNDASRIPWTTDQCVPLAERINANQHLIDQLVVAGNSPGFWIPSGVVDDVDAEFQAKVERMSVGRQIALPWLLARAQLRIGENELDSAWNDISASYGLIDLICGKTLLGYLYRSHLKQRVDAVAINLVHAESIDDSLANRVAERLLDDPQPHVAATLYQERCFQAECIVSLYRYQVSGVTAADDDVINTMQTSLLMKGSLDWNVCLKEINDLFDEIDAASTAVGDKTKRAKHLDALMAKREQAANEISSLASRAKGYFSREHRSQLVAYEVTRFFFNEYERFMDNFDQDAHRRAVNKLAIEIASYRRTHEVYPETLDPVHKSKSVFQFAIENFKYRRLPDGYLLYCYGVNGMDDDGSMSDQTFRGIANWPDVVAMGPEHVEKVLTRHGENDVIGVTADYSTLVSEGADDISIRISDANLSLDEWLVEKAK